MATLTTQHENIPVSDTELPVFLAKERLAPRTSISGFPGILEASAQVRRRLLSAGPIRLLPRPDEGGETIHAAKGYPSGNESGRAVQIHYPLNWARFTFFSGTCLPYRLALI
jgi:hypothetical protein